MSHKARRAWMTGLVGLAALGACIAAVIWLRVGLAPATAQEGGGGAGGTGDGGAAAALDELTWSRVSVLRRRLCLSDEELAAMGCDGQAAEAALGRLLAWYRSNQATWAARRTAVRNAKRALQRATRRLGVGPPDGALSAAMPTLEAALTAAEAAEKYG